MKSIGRVEVPAGSVHHRAPARGSDRPDGSAGTFRSLRQRNAKLFFAGMLVSNCGTWMQSTAQGWLVYRLSGQGTSLGLVLACQFLPLLVLGPWAGVLADRMNRRRLDDRHAGGHGRAGRPPRRPRPDRARDAAARVRPRPGPRRPLGHRQPGPAQPRHRARRRGGHPERPLAQHGRHDREPRVRPGARRAARRPDRHRLVLHGQRGVVLRRAGQPPAPQPGAAPDRGAGATGRQARCGRGCASSGGTRCSARPSSS